MLPLAIGKDYPSISKIGQQNPGMALEDSISACFTSDFQICHTKIYQNTNFQLTSSCESKDIPIELYSLPTLKNNIKLTQNLGEGIIQLQLWKVTFLHILSVIFRYFPYQNLSECKFSAPQLLRVQRYSNFGIANVAKHHVERNWLLISNFPCPISRNLLQLINTLERAYTPNFSHF